MLSVYLRSVYATVVLKLLKLFTWFMTIILGLSGAM